MKISTDITINDYNLYIADTIRLQQKRSKSFLSHAPLILFFLLVIASVFLLRIGNCYIHYYSLGGGILIGFTMTTLAIVSQKKIFTPQKNGFLLGNRTYILSEENIIIEKSGYNSQTLWSKVSFVYYTKDSIYIFLDKCTAFIIPKRTLSNKDLHKVIKLIESVLDKEQIIFI